MPTPLFLDMKKFHKIFGLIEVKSEKKILTLKANDITPKKSAKQNDSNSNGAKES